MEIKVRQVDDFAVVRVEGRIVRENHGELRTTLEELISQGTKGIALDFEAVDYMDSSGLGSCAAARKLLKEKGHGAIVMFAPSPNVEKMWKLIRLDLAIPCFQKEKDALSRLKAETVKGEASQPPRISG